MAFIQKEDLLNTTSGGLDGFPPLHWRFPPEKTVQ